jgi:hypothetical protein
MPPASSYSLLEALPFSSSSFSSSSLDSLLTDRERRWLALFFCLYLLLYAALRTHGTARGREGSLAYVLVSLVATVQFVTYGLTALFDGSLLILATSGPRLAGGPGTHAGFSALTEVTFPYELFNTAAALVLPQYRTREFLGHHLSTLAVAKLAQWYGPDLYGLFYLGLASLSTLPLVAVDVFRHGPRELATAHPGLNKLARVAFALTFLLVRAVIWPMVSAALWYDVVVLILRRRRGATGGGDDDDDDDDKPMAYLIFLLLANTGLGLLQLVWARRIVKGLVKVVRGKDLGSEINGRSGSGSGRGGRTAEAVDAGAGGSGRARRRRAKAN